MVGYPGIISRAPLRACLPHKLVGKWRQGNTPLKRLYAGKKGFGIDMRAAKRALEAKEHFAV